MLIISKDPMSSFKANLPNEARRLFRMVCSAGFEASKVHGRQSVELSLLPENNWVEKGFVLTGTAV